MRTKLPEGTLVRVSGDLERHVYKVVIRAPVHRGCGRIGTKYMLNSPTKPTIWRTRSQICRLSQLELSLYQL